MKNGEKVALNIYGIVDNELNRMHALLQGYFNMRSGHRPDSDIPELYKRILDIQNVLLKALESHDEVIQEKVAEMAFTGDSDET